MHCVGTRALCTVLSSHGTQTACDSREEDTSPLTEILRGGNGGRGYTELNGHGHRILMPENRKCRGTLWQLRSRCRTLPSLARRGCTRAGGSCGRAKRNGNARSRTEPVAYRDGSEAGTEGTDRHRSIVRVKLRQRVMEGVG